MYFFYEYLGVAGVSVLRLVVRGVGGGPRGEKSLRNFFDIFLLAVGKKNT
jgi:hypothetical protein